MELWIRSQDKTNLILAKDIVVSDGNIKVYKETELYTTVAMYKTKGRALEILDEIQNILKPKTIVNTHQVEQAQLVDGTTFIQPMLDDIQVKNVTSYVYEMPNE